MEKERLVECLINIYYDEETGLVDLTGLDFSPYNVTVDISNMSVRYSLHQDDQKVGGDLFQNGQRVSDNLHQDFQRVAGNLFQDEQFVGRNLLQDGQTVGGRIHQDKLKEMTQQEIEEALGYKIKIKEEG